MISFLLTSLPPAYNVSCFTEKVSQVASTLFLETCILLNLSSLFQGYFFPITDHFQPSHCFVIINIHSVFLNLHKLYHGIF